MDPPYNQGHEKRVLEFLRKMQYVTEDTLIVVEASLETDFSYLHSMGWAMMREKKYKTNKHVFIRKE